MQLRQTIHLNGKDACLGTLQHIYTDKKGNKTFLKNKDIQMGSGAKSYMRKGFLLYEEICKFFHIYEEAVCHI